MGHAKGLGLVAGATLLALSAIGRAADIPTHDVAGAPTTTLLPRYLNAKIISYDESDDEEAVLPDGPFRDFGFTRTRTLEGRVTRIAYVLPETLSTIAVMNHYREVLKGGGFKVLFQCDGRDGCGGFSFGEALTEPMADAHAGDEGNSIIDYLHPVGGDVRYVLATLDQPQGRVTVALLVARHLDRQPGVFIETVTQPPEGAAPPAENATVIASSLHVRGSITLRGIAFVGGTARLRRDSRTVLAQVAAMLHGNPAMRLLVVGHTDTQQALAEAVKLTSAQAQAVVDALERRWKVSADQVGAMGVGPACPVASNADPAGRALNRRIELVLQAE